MARYKIYYPFIISIANPNCRGEGWRRNSASTQKFFPITDTATVRFQQFLFMTRISQSFCSRFLRLLEISLQALDMPIIKCIHLVSQDHQPVEPH